ncbi:hypothetical protein HK101_002972 [Irineochytrium annulatum]|nr:hypothetical protein HK101_002972 [Irineochytrium annulatum]
MVSACRAGARGRPHPHHLATASISTRCVGAFAAESATSGRSHQQAQRRLVSSAPEGEGEEKGAGAKKVVKGGPTADAAGKVSKVEGKDAAAGTGANASGGKDAAAGGGGDAAAAKKAVRKKSERTDGASQKQASPENVAAKSKAAAAPATAEPEESEREPYAHDGPYDPLYSDQDIPLLRSRLEEHYYTSLLEDIMILRYKHDSKGALSVAQVDKLLEKKYTSQKSAHQPPGALDFSWPRVSPSHTSDVFKAFTGPLQRLPTLPCHPSHTRHQKLLARLSARHVAFMPKWRWQRRLFNPIDVTTVRRAEYERFVRKAREREAVRRGGGRGDERGFKPVPERMPVLRKVTLKIWEVGAVANKNILLSAVMALTAITGVKAEPLFAIDGDATKKIREGMPIGAVVEVTGSRAYEFLDKLIQTVLPRLREWDGVDPYVIDTHAGAGSVTGGRIVGRRNRSQPDRFARASITLKIPDTAVGLFPDLEPHYESYPRLFDTTVTIDTTSEDLEGAVLLLSGFQMPFKEGAEPPKAAEVEEDDDPYAKFRKAKKGRDAKNPRDKKKK